jgi:hypothetical protein
VTEQAPELPEWVLKTALGGASAVAAVAAVASYVHMKTLGENAGQGLLSWGLPLSVDGLLVVSGMVMFVRRCAGQAAGCLPWIGLVLGLLASLSANVAVAGPDPLSWVVSGWPPVSLAVAFELLIMIFRHMRPEQSAVDTPNKLSEQSEQPPGDEQTPSTEKTQTGQKSRRRLSAVPNSDKFADFEAWAAELGQRPSGKQIRDRYGCGYTKAQELLASLDDDKEEAS